MKLFGTDGIRGEAGKYPLDEQTIISIGRKLASLLAEKGDTPSVVIGKDTRDSGPWIEKALAAGITSAGGMVESAGVIPTPGIAYAISQNVYAAGIMISASHNKYRDNGIKIFGAGGYKLDDSMEERIEALILSEDGTQTAAPDDTRIQENDGLLDDYKHYLINIAGEGSFSGMKIMLDCANGAAWPISLEVFSELGAEVVAIGAEPNGKNINENCGSQNTDSLRSAVKENGIDVGIAFDGDADRAIFAAPSGKVLDGDHVMYALGRSMMSKGKLKRAAVVSTVMSNLGLENALAKHDIEMLRTGVGDRQVLECMLNGGYNFGGEQSGHIICLDHATTGDGLLTGIKVLELLADQRETIEAITADMEKYPQILLNVAVNEKPPLDENAAVMKAVKEAEDELGKTGRVLLRYSGTEPLARVMVEGIDDAQIKRVARNLAGTVEKELS